MARFDALGIVVSDMGRAIGFYEKLGLSFPDGAASQPHAEAVLPGGIRLMLDTVATIESFDDRWTEPSGGHRIGLAFLCESPAAVDELYGSLVGGGVESYKEPFDAFWGQRYAQVCDPDGNVVDLFAPLS